MTTLDDVLRGCGRYLLVEIEPDLAAHGTTSSALWLGIKHVPGVRCITDMAIMSPSMLASMCGVPDAESMVQPPAGRRRKTRRAGAG